MNKINIFYANKLVAGMAGRQFTKLTNKRISRITGLDPAR